MSRDMLSYAGKRCGSHEEADVNLLILLLWTASSDGSDFAEGRQGDLRFAIGISALLLKMGKWLVIALTDPMPDLQCIPSEDQAWWNQSPGRSKALRMSLRTHEVGRLPHLPKQHVPLCARMESSGH